MKTFLDRATVTGADDTVRPEELLRLSREFRFVEWGILVSKTTVGKPRYPSREWLKELRELCLPLGRQSRPQLSMHMCGRWVRDLCNAEAADFLHEMSEFLPMFNRIQINWSPYFNDCDMARACWGIRLLDFEFPNLELILQMGKNHDQDKWGRLVKWLHAAMIPFSILQDGSGGKGLLPEKWERFQDIFMGFAGGLTPENVVEQLGKIGEVVADNDLCWIDMESGAREEVPLGLQVENRFSLDRVQTFLEHSEPWILGD